MVFACTGLPGAACSALNNDCWRGGVYLERLAIVNVFYRKNIYILTQSYAICPKIGTMI